MVSAYQFEVQLKLNYRLADEFSWYYLFVSGLCRQTRVRSVYGSRTVKFSEKKKTKPVLEVVVHVFASVKRYCEYFFLKKTNFKCLRVRWTPSMVYSQTKRFEQIGFAHLGSSQAQKSITG